MHIFSHSTPRYDMVLVKRYIKRCKVGVTDSPYLTPKQTMIKMANMQIVGGCFHIPREAPFQ